MEACSRLATRIIVQVCNTELLLFIFGVPSDPADIPWSSAPKSDLSFAAIVPSERDDREVLHSETVPAAQ